MEAALDDLSDERWELERGRVPECPVTSFLLHENALGLKRLEQLKGEERIPLRVPAQVADETGAVPGREYIPGCDELRSGPRRQVA